MKRLLTLFYLLSPIWIFPLVGLLFNFKPIDTISLIVISELIIFIFLFIAHRVKAQFKFLRKGTHLTGVIVIITLLHLNVARELILFVAFLLFLLALPLHFYPEKFHYILRDLVNRTEKKLEKRSLRCVVHFLIAVLFLLLFLPSKFIILGLIVTLIGDPLSYFIGKHLGKRKLFRDKTLEGSLAFFLGSLFTLFIYTQNLYFASILSFTGAITELLTGKWVDDNASVPLVVSFLAYLISSAY